VNKLAENPIFSYTRRDYEGSRKEGLAKIPIISKGNWTDLNATDPGIILLDYVHALVDMLSYYQDHQALETFITTAKERANIFRLAKQLSYSIRSSKGAICNVEFSVPLKYDFTIKIPKYTSVSTNSGISYLTIEDKYLLSGEAVVTVPCSQGKLNTITYKGTGISRLSSIPNASNQVLRISSNNIDIDSITIIDNIGRIWKPVDYITFSTEIDRVYQVELNPDDSVSIKFGDGERGIVPKETDILTITYVTTLADEGRVNENEITILDTPIYDSKGNYIEFLVNNNNASTGGSKSQSSREIRELAPGAIKAQNRAVTLNDFENLAKLVEGVADARAYDINTKPDLCLYHEVKVLITPEDNNGDINILKDRVYNYLSQRMIPPTNLQILTPSYIDIDIEVIVKKLDTAVEGRLSYQLQQNIIEYFKDREGSIGEDFYPSDLSSILRNTEGVRSIISISPNNTVKAADLSVLRLGNVNIIIE
jgi:uncharacterized phage protein gp47/JayE